MTKQRKKMIGKILAWFNARMKHLTTGSFAKSRDGAIDEMWRRKYPVGQWHRWYQANKKYQRITGGENLRRWQVR